MKQLTYQPEQHSLRKCALKNIQSEAVGLAGSGSGLKLAISLSPENVVFRNVLCIKRM